VLSSALAESLTRAGHSVLLIRGEPADSRYDLNPPVTLPTDGALKLKGSPSRDFTSFGLAISGARDTYSLESIRAGFASYRARFAFTVIDAPEALSSGSAISLARAADLVVVAVEDGRSICSADRELAKTLKGIGANVLGVVTLDPKTIASAGAKRLPQTLPAVIGTAVAVTDDMPRRKSVLSSMIG
jgi:hypothetical protein